MKIGLCLTILAIVNAVTVCPAAAQSEQSQQGTILNVQKQDVATPSTRTGAPANRAPLQSHYFLYNVSVQVNCEVYVGRYETELNDLPSAMSANNAVPVRLQKKVMYLDFPGDTVQMRIVQHKVSREGACGQTAPAK